jgi:hypothetical protein
MRPGANPSGCGLCEVFLHSSLVAARHEDVPSSRLDRSQKYSRQGEDFRVTGYSLIFGQTGIIFTNGLVNITHQV